MRFAIISDIHANYVALRTAFKYMRKLMIDKVICLGDIVGYGAEPNECVDAVRKYCHFTIMGNHDNAVINREAAKRFNAEAQKAIDWTIETTTEKNKDFLRKLPMKIRASDFIAVHASPLNPEKWGYVLPDKMSGKEWKCFDTPICFIGHSHIPMVITPDGLVDENPLYIEDDTRYIINVGSIGQPRDGDKRLCFGLYDQDEGIYEEIRLEYDYKSSARKIRKAGLPVFLSNRLLMGK